MLKISLATNSFWGIRDIRNERNMEVSKGFALEAEIPMRFPIALATLPRNLAGPTVVITFCQNR